MVLLNRLLILLKFSRIALAAKENMRTESFAQKLCVSFQGNVDCIKNAQLEEGQKGLLFSLSNHKVLYANGIYDKVYPASITKIMTAMLALQSGKLNDTVTITQDNVTLEDGSQVCGFVPAIRLPLISFCTVCLYIPAMMQLLPLRNMLVAIQRTSYR